MVLGRHVFELVASNQLAKGDVLTVAQLAGALHSGAMLAAISRRGPTVPRPAWLQAYDARPVPCSPHAAAGSALVGFSLPAACQHRPLGPSPQA